MGRALLNLNLTAASGNYSIERAINAPSMILEVVNVSYDTADHALAAPSLLVNLPFFGYDGTCIDSNRAISRGNLPIFNTGAAVSTYCPKMEINLSEPVGSTFPYSVSTIAGADPAFGSSNLIEINLVFSYEKK